MIRRRISHYAQKREARIAIAVVLLVAIFFLYTVLTRTSSAQPVQFQPEAAMLVHATDPGSSLMTSSGIGQSSTSSAKLPYAFSASLCTTSGTEHFNCLKTYYQNLVTKYGVGVAFADLKKRYAVDPFTAAQCHPITHAIGFTAYATYPSVNEAYAHGDSFCWSGYFHGVLEAVVAKIGYENLPAKINTICADISGKESYSFDYYNCIHGIGHGIMELESDDVFSSLKICDNLNGDWQKQSCFGGVFMENIIAYDRDGSVPDLKDADPLYPCTAVSDSYKSACYLGQTSFVLEKNGGDFAKTFALCGAVAEPYRDICDQSLGRDAANYARHDPAQTKSTCQLSSDTTAAYNCVVGALKEMVSYYHSDIQAKTFCGLFETGEKTSCLSETAAYYKVF